MIFAAVGDLSLECLSIVVLSLDKIYDVSYFNNFRSFDTSADIPSVSAFDVFSMGSSATEKIFCHLCLWFI